MNLYINYKEGNIHFGPVVQEVFSNAVNKVQIQKHLVKDGQKAQKWSYYTFKLITSHCIQSKLPEVGLKMVAAK